MEYITGYVSRIVYRNEDNGYTVAEVSSGGEDQTIVGTLPLLQAGEYIEAHGSMKDHAVYGEQLYVQGYQIKAPEDEAAIERYLASGAIKGIGKALAGRIVKKFGTDSFRIIEEEPERLAEVKGISLGMAQKIGAQAGANRSQRDAMMFLQQYGISLSLAARIYKEYGEAVYGIIEQNPYRLADDIPGVGFKIADGIAARAGISADSDYRIESAIQYVLLSSLSAGHTYLPRPELEDNTRRLLGVDTGSFEERLASLSMDHRIKIKEKDGKELVYAAGCYYTELNTARHLIDLDHTFSADPARTRAQIEAIERESGIELDAGQREAVEACAGHGVLVITGGPGTGKTTAISAIISFFEMNGMSVELAAPTGRAAKRMSEATGCEARTIHRMLEISGVNDDSTANVHYGRNRDNPLEADVVIIDEMSMVDIQLMENLLEAIPMGTRLIMVGDMDQLPSVGPGNVLKDIINSGRFHVVRLVKIFRQEEASDIIVNAHRINRGEHVDLSARSRDFLFINRGSANAVLNAVLTLMTDKLPAYLGCETFDIQVMAPMRKGSLGVERMNRILQEYLNPPHSDRVQYEYNGSLFREGDKVMQIKNDYQKEWEVRNRYGFTLESGLGVFNGDIGIIESINTFAEQVCVRFDEDRITYYDFGELDELVLAYAVTIHKAQGSEYEAVIIPLISGPRMLMTRNLLYTAVTRARSCVCIVGSAQAVNTMIDNETEQRRYSSLADRLEEL